MPTRRTPGPSLAMCSTTRCMVSWRRPGGEIEVLGPELAELLLVGLHAVAHIGGGLGLALLVDDGRQIAADADRIHGLEEEEFVVAEQVLHVVLGGGDEHVDAGIVQKFVEMIDIERNRLADLLLLLLPFAFSLGAATPIRAPLTLRHAIRASWQSKPALNIGCLPQANIKLGSRPNR